jgi:putative FmdB family regulatory protein
MRGSPATVAERPALPMRNSGVVGAWQSPSVENHPVESLRILEMPIYEYRCEKCQHELEAIQKISEAPLRACPACGKKALVKRISAAGFRLKGGGWYETDFKSKGKRNVAGDGGGDGSGAKESAGSDAAKSPNAGGEAAKSESKPAKSDTPVSSGSGAAKST